MVSEDVTDARGDGRCIENISVVTHWALGAGALALLWSWLSVFIEPKQMTVPLALFVTVLYVAAVVMVGIGALGGDDQ